MEFIVFFMNFRNSVAILFLVAIVVDGGNRDGSMQLGNILSTLWFF